jgi:cytochrome c-type biogenesis protein CcmF
MIPELGHVALIIALQLALLQGFFGLVGASRGYSAWVAAARGAATGQFVFVASGFAALMWSFAINDFSVMNVADHSSRRLPLAYRLTATWGSHEGSMLLWTLMLAGWTLAVVRFGRSRADDLTGRAIGILGLISGAFLAFVLLTSNPFMRLHPPPLDGRDLNPLLQDPGMIIHPPLLYMGYVGFSVAFAFSVAALLARRVDNAWAGWLRPWTLAAWTFLTLGIMVGSWWAYYELGWGGWWFWDPTENASLMPWLAGTALLHSLMVADKRGSFRVWTLFLAICVFSLSLLGTFLVRSGVLSSVHAFAQDPLRGVFILGLLCLVVGGSLLVFATRAGSVRSGGEFAPVSRESAILVGNVLLLVVLATVMLGTLYPLLLDALGLGKISVGAPYFNAVFVPLMVPVLLLAGIASHLRWREAPLAGWISTALIPAGVALAMAVLLPLGFDEWRWQAALGAALAGWILAATAVALIRRRREAGALPLSALGMGLAHAGLAVGTLGIGIVSAYQTESSIAMAPGETARLGGYEFVFRGASEIPGPNYSAMRGTLLLSRDGREIDTLLPEKRIYPASGMTMTESAIRYGVTGDIYVALGEPLPRGRWSVQLYIKPFIGWIWMGGILMALGGLLAAIGLRRGRATA